MPIMFNRFSDGSWGGTSQGVQFFIEDDGGKPNSAQQDLADHISAGLDAVKKQASDYLDLFIDRAKAGGCQNETWFLEEVEMRGLSNSNARIFKLTFTLTGDDGGYWDVQFRFGDGAILPFRFGRIQQ